MLSCDELEDKCLDERDRSTGKNKGVAELDVTWCSAVQLWTKQNCYDTDCGPQVLTKDLLFSTKKTLSVLNRVQHSKIKALQQRPFLIHLAAMTVVGLVGYMNTHIHRLL